MSVLRHLTSALDVAQALPRRAVPRHLHYLVRRTFAPIRVSRGASPVVSLRPVDPVRESAAPGGVAAEAPGLAQEVGRLLAGEVPVLGRFVPADEVEALPLRERWDASAQQHLVTLARARRLGFGDEVREFMLSEAGRFASAWPPFRRPVWDNALINGQRLVSWCLTARLAAAAGDWDALEPVLRDGIRGAAEHVHANLSTYKAVPNCHLIGELAALVFAEATFSSLALPGQTPHRLRLLEAAVDAQVFPDGVGREQSMGYHAFVLEALVLARLGARALGVATRLDGPIRAMAGYLRDTRQPDGDSPPLGDSDDARMFRLTSSSLPRDPGQVARIALDQDAEDEEGAWLKVLFGEGGTRSAVQGPSRPSSPTPGVLRWAEAGHVRLRASGSGGDHYLFCRSGEFGLGGRGFSAHAHADLLSFILFVDGEAWVTEAGPGSYAASGADRNWFRSADAHNAVRPAGEGVGVFGGRFWWAAVPDGCVLRAEPDEVVAEMAWRGWRWRRTFRADWGGRSVEVITERLEGEGAWDWFLHPASPSRISGEGEEWEVRSEAGFVATSLGGDVRPMACRHAKGYGRVVEAVCVQGRVGGDRHVLRLCAG